MDMSYLAAFGRTTVFSGAQFQAAEICGTVRVVAAERTFVPWNVSDGSSGGKAPGTSTT